MFFKLLKHSALAGLLGLGLINASASHAAALEFDLSGLGMDVPSNYVGRDGLFVGSKWSYYTNPGNNWTFNDVKLSINDNTGVGIMSGTINRNSDNSVWTINTTLNDLVVRTGTGASTTRQDYNAGTDNLSSILSSMVDGTGVEWKSLDMTLSNSTSFWNFGGFAMPDMGHLNVAELFFHSDFGSASGLIFDAWYKSFQTVTKYRWVWKEKEICDRNGRCFIKKYKVKEAYKAPKYVGDTKAYAQVNPVPLPAAFWLFAPVVAGFTAWRRKQA